MIGPLSVSVKDRGFFSLEWSFVHSNRIRILWTLQWKSRRWCRRRQSSKRFLRGFWVRRGRSELVLCQEGPRELTAYGGRRFWRFCRRHWSCDGLDSASCLFIGFLQVVMDVSDSFQSFLDVVSWTGFGWRWWSGEDSCFMKHLLLSCFCPVGISRVEEIARGLSFCGNGFFRFVRSF